ncbi:MAG TPA: hypothetical protein EYO40_03385 [Phycisphaerales bacterium]|nr:hypothetical protein [Phycisphaerales bacterium]HIO20105.1 hypothetical protein [Phycisphaerales bacterium]
MHIEGPIPFSVAQAYGAQKVTQVTQAVTATPVQQIVAGQVAGKVDFGAVDISNAQPLQLYSRSADCIEAATRIATGQHLNIEA